MLRRNCFWDLHTGTRYLVYVLETVACLEGNYLGFVWDTSCGGESINFKNGGTYHINQNQLEYDNIGGYMVLGSNAGSNYCAPPGKKS